MNVTELIKSLREDIAFFHVTPAPLMGGCFTLYKHQESLPTMVGEVTGDERLLFLADEAREIKHWSAQSREYVTILSRIVTLLEAELVNG